MQTVLLVLFVLVVGAFGVSWGVLCFFPPKTDCTHIGPVSDLPLHKSGQCPQYEPGPPKDITPIEDRTWYRVYMREGLPMVVIGAYAASIVYLSGGERIEAMTAEEVDAERDRLLGPDWRTRPPSPPVKVTPIPGRFVSLGIRQGFFLGKEG